MSLFDFLLARLTGNCHRLFFQPQNIKSLNKIYLERDWRGVPGINCTGNNDRDYKVTSKCKYFYCTKYLITPNDAIKFVHFSHFSNCWERCSRRYWETSRRNYLGGVKIFIGMISFENCVIRGSQILLTCLFLSREKLNVIFN